MTRSPKGMGNAVYKLEYWYDDFPENVYIEGPYATKGAAKGRLTSKQNNASYDYYKRKIEGRVLELSGEWVEVA